MDLAAGMVEVAKERYPRATFVQVLLYISTKVIQHGTVRGADASVFLFVIVLVVTLGGGVGRGCTF